MRRRKHLDGVWSALLSFEFPKVVLVTSGPANLLRGAESALVLRSFGRADSGLASIREPLERELDGVGGARELGRAAKPRINV